MMKRIEPSENIQHVSKSSRKDSTLPLVRTGQCLGYFHNANPEVKPYVSSMLVLIGNAIIIGLLLPQLILQCKHMLNQTYHEKRVQKYVVSAFTLISVIEYVVLSVSTYWNTKNIIDFLKKLAEVDPNGNLLDEQQWINYLPYLFWCFCISLGSMTPIYRLCLKNDNLFGDLLEIPFEIGTHVLEWFVVLFFVYTTKIIGLTFSKLASRIENEAVVQSSLIKHVSNQYYMLYKLCALLQQTNVYGVQITAVCLYGLVACCLDFYSFTLNLSSVTFAIHVVPIGYFILQTCTKMYIVFSAADYVRNQASNVSIQLTTLDNKSMEPNEQLQLTLLFQKINCMPVDIKACGFVTFNKSLFVTVISIIMTYTIILLQFEGTNQSNQKPIIGGENQSLS